MSVRDAILSFRDRMLTSPTFIRHAKRFPPTRVFARKNARALFHICAGFVYSQILLGCVQANVFESLGSGPKSAEELAGAANLSPDAMARLLRAAVALRLLDGRGDGRFGLGPLGAAMISNPSIASMVIHHQRLYADLADPLALLRSGGRDSAMSDYWPYASRRDPKDLSSAETAPYTALMAHSQTMISEEILDAISIRRFRRLADIGGGNGAFIRAARENSPATEFVLFDLPAVIDDARSRFEAADLGKTIHLTQGSFFDDDFPVGADAITLIRIIHDHDDDAALTILRKAHAALPPGGTLIVAEPFAEVSGAEPIGDAYFGFYLLAMGSGKPRTRRSLISMIEAAGFSTVRHVPTKLSILVSILDARK
ncbi:MAG: methyltransferase [Rhodospirillaceae bacterium]|nr:methyltransferase [Rhodospirillaceae bacterium]